MRGMSWWLVAERRLVVLGLGTAAIVLSACGDAPPPEHGTAGATVPAAAERLEDAPGGSTGSESAVPEGGQGITPPAPDAEPDEGPGADAAPPGPGDGSSAQQACLTEWATGLAVAVAAEPTRFAEEGTAWEAWVLEAFVCFPEIVLPLILADLGVDVERLSAAERVCVEAWAAGLDPVDLPAGDDPAALLPGLIACGLDLVSIDTLEAPAAAARDDHGNTPAAATVVGVGEVVVGTLAHEEGPNRRDVFVFAAEEGVLYQIAFAGGTEGTVDVSLFRYARELDQIFPLAYFEGGGGPRHNLFWRAPSSQATYIEVLPNAFNWDPERETYTLIVLTPAIADDHGDTHESATALALDTAMQGEIDYRGDSDHFVFEAAAGVLYQIDVVPDTLADPGVALSSPESMYLAENYDPGEDRRVSLYWEAPATGPYFVEVRAAWRKGPTGSYTLTVSVR